MFCYKLLAEQTAPCPSSCEYLAQCRLPAFAAQVEEEPEDEDTAIADVSDEEEEESDFDAAGFQTSYEEGCMDDSQLRDAVIDLKKSADNQLVSKVSHGKGVSRGKKPADKKKIDDIMAQFGMEDL